MLVCADDAEENAIDKAVEKDYTLAADLTGSSEAR
jgi:hypothetical protein